LATKELIEASQDFGIYHVANSAPATWYEAVLELFKIKNIKIKVLPVGSDKFPRPAKRPKNSMLLNTKVKPLRDYRLALEEYLKIK
jgi:dTDP-4-dehydrorhamnose reductase